MKNLKMGEILIYLMSSILILFFILSIGKLINMGFDNYETFTTGEYSGIIYENSKSGDIITLQPELDLSENVVMPITYSIVKKDGKEIDEIEIDNSGVVKVSQDISGVYNIGDKLELLISLEDGSNNKMTSNLIIDVSNVISTFINPVDDNTKVKENKELENSNDKINNMLDQASGLLSKMTNGIGNIDSYVNNNETFVGCPITDVDENKELSNNVNLQYSAY